MQGNEEIANEFEATLLGCDSLIGQVSTLLARGYIADEEDDDDDSDYSSCSLSDDTDG